MDAHTIVRAFALVARVGRLNPSAGEIGPGMLATNSPAWEVAESTLQNLIELSDPTTVSEYIGHIRTAIQQSKEANT